MVGIKDSNKTVVRKSDLGQHNIRNNIINNAGVKLGLCIFLSRILRINSIAFSYIPLKPLIKYGLFNVSLLA